MKNAYPEQNSQRSPAQYENHEQFLALAVNVSHDFALIDDIESCISFTILTDGWQYFGDTKKQI